MLVAKHLPLIQGSELVVDGFSGVQYILDLPPTKDDRMTSGIHDGFIGIPD